LEGLIPVHWLSKEARFKIIDVMLSTRTANSLAAELGLSRSAIRKYINRETHPSDEVMQQIFQVCKPYERDRIVRIAIDDLIEAIKMLSKSIENSEQRKYLAEKLREVLESLE